MRIIVCWLAAVTMAMLAWSADTAPAGKKTSAKKTVATKGTARKGTGKAGAGARKSTGTRKTAARGGKKGATRTTWRNRQLAPAPERYKEIQGALAAKGYLKPEDATGSWNQTSTDALKRFQADQNIDSTGKINSLSLIALGLGPKHETASAVKPPVQPAPQ
jgi:hypothetical protein